MAIYFVDYTSTGEHGLNGIDQLDANDTVYLFYDFLSNSLSMKQLESICECAAKLKLVDMGYSTILESARVKIATYLNYEVGKNGTTEAFVITESTMPFGLVGSKNGNLELDMSAMYGSCISQILEAAQSKTEDIPETV